MGLLDESFFEDPQRMAMMRFGLGLLGSGGQTNRGIAAGLGGMLEGNAADRKRKQDEELARQHAQMQGLQIQGLQSDQDLKRAQVEMQNRIKARMMGLNQPGAMPPNAGPQSPGYASALPGVGGNPRLPGPDWMQNFQRQAQAPQQAPQAPGAQGGYSKQAELDRMRQMADIREQEGDVAGAAALREHILKSTPKFANEPRVVMSPDGKPMLVQMADDGTVQPIQGGYGVADKLHFADNGKSINGMDQYTGDVRSTLQKFQDPNSIASNMVAMRGQNMTDSRARDFNAIQTDANNMKRSEKQDEKAAARAGQVASFDTMLSTLDRLGNHPGLSRSVGPVGAFPTMPGSESANFQAELNTFQSQAFLPMVSQLKGMGALSDAEGKKLTAAVGALDPRMGEQAFRNSITLIAQQMAAARDRATGMKKSPSPGAGGWSMTRVD